MQCCLITVVECVGCKVEPALKDQPIGQVQLRRKAESSVKNVWSFKTGGLLWQCCLRQVLLYRIALQCPH